MSKKYKTRNKEMRKAKKRALKEQKRQEYLAKSAQGIKKDKSQTIGRYIVKNSSHGPDRCYNVGCARCFGVDTRIRQGSTNATAKPRRNGRVYRPALKAA